MNILDKIVANKRKEVAERKLLLPISKMIFEPKKSFSLKQALLCSSSGIIAEFKRKSPSKGWIHQDANIVRVVGGYSENGATGISCLTDFQYFGGTNEDFLQARKVSACPMLRKDFVIDEYQLYEAKKIGADVVLLIAAALTKAEVKRFALLAHQLGLEVLLEIHNEEELDWICDEVDLVGVNNRNLKTFVTDVQISIDLVSKIPAEFVKISESGISSVETVRRLRTFGFQGFLMGENFMKNTQPEEALRQFVNALN